MKKYLEGILIISLISVFWTAVQGNARKDEHRLLESGMWGVCKFYGRILQLLRNIMFGQCNVPAMRPIAFINYYNLNLQR